MIIKAPTKNLYEVLVIIKPNLSDSELEKNLSQLESSIKNYGGSIVKTEEPIRRKFTHPIKGFKDGYYLSVLFNSPPELPATLKRTLSISDYILRSIVVRKGS